MKINTLYNKSLSWEQNKMILNDRLVQKLARARKESTKDLISIALRCLDKLEGKQNIWAFTRQPNVRFLLTGKTY